MTAPRKIGTMLWVGVALLALAAAGLAARSYLQQPPAGAVLSSDACALPQQPCLAKGAGQQILFAIDSPLSSHSDLRLRVELSGLEANSVTVNFDGADMYMGYNRVLLTRGDDGIFRATTPLPVCVTGEMRWRATVLVTQKTTQTRADFLFTTL